MTVTLEVILLPHLPSAVIARYSGEYNPRFGNSSENDMDADPVPEARTFPLLSVTWTGTPDGMFSMETVKVTVAPSGTSIDSGSIVASGVVRMIASLKDKGIVAN